MTILEDDHFQKTECERSLNGLKNARAKGVQLGRPQTRNSKLIISLRKKGYTYQQIRKLLGVGHGTITKAIRESHIKDEDE